MKEEEENYENMKQQLIEVTREKHFNLRKEDPKFQKVEKVKLEQEKIYLNRKENLLMKLHNNEQTLLKRQQQKKKDTEELKKINEQKQKRKDIVKENYLKKLEIRRKELSKKLK